MFSKIVTWTKGRSTAFAVFFAGFGSILAWFHRLDGSYVGLVTALQAYVVIHSTKEDYFNSKAAETEKKDDKAIK